MLNRRLICRFPYISLKISKNYTTDDIQSHGLCFKEEDCAGSASKINYSSHKTFAYFQHQFLQLTIKLKRMLFHAHKETAKDVVWQEINCQRCLYSITTKSPPAGKTTKHLNSSCKKYNKDNSDISMTSLKVESKYLRNCTCTVKDVSKHNVRSSFDQIRNYFNVASTISGGSVKLQSDYLQNNHTCKRLFPNLKTSSQSHKSTHCYWNRRKSIFSHLAHLLLVVQMLSFCTSPVTAVWWSPGGNSNLVNSSEICQWARQVGGPQLQMCEKHMPVIEQVQTGIERAIEACQEELKYNRWNCSQISKSHFARVMSQDTRENAFVQAMTAAAITYQISSACAKGDIEECGCRNNRRLRNKLLRLEAMKRNITVDYDTLRTAVDNFEWGGCGDNVDYGMAKSRQFLKLHLLHGHKDRGSSKEKIKYHNQEAGRMAIENYRKRKCTCHGLSGSCTMWTCWMNMPRFPQVQKRLKSRYNYAVRVVNGNDGETLVPARRRFRKRRGKRLTRRVRSAISPRSRNSNRRMRRNRIHKINSRSSIRRLSGRKFPRMKRGSLAKRLWSEEMIFMQKSPSFCVQSRKRGSLGTKGRDCDPKKQGLGSCRYMCCGRGYTSKQVNIVRSCHCVFQFCCNVTCDKCVERKTLHFCS